MIYKQQAWDSDPSRHVFNQEERKILNSMVEAQRLADRVVDLAVAWRKSDIGDCLDQAEALENAIDELLAFRRKTPIVKSR